MGLQFKKFVTNLVNLLVLPVNVLRRGNESSTNGLWVGWVHIIGQFVLSEPTQEFGPKSTTQENTFNVTVYFEIQSTEWGRTGDVGQAGQDQNRVAVQGGDGTEGNRRNAGSQAGRVRTRNPER